MDLLVLMKLFLFLGILYYLTPAFKYIRKLLIRLLSKKKNND